MCKVRATEIGTQVQIELKIGPRWFDFGFMNYKERDELAKIIKQMAYAVRDGVSYGVPEDDHGQD